MSLNRTPIEWVLNPDRSPGYTWNPITGCLNGCNYCYARTIANGRVKKLYLANENLAPSQFGTINLAANEIYDPFYPRFWPERLKSRKQGFGDYMSGAFQKGIFVCDMSDLFGIGIPEEWTRRVLQRIKEKNNHRFYLLTKQPQNLAKFSPFPDNCWVGVSATNNTSLDKAMLGLADIVASKRYVSFEPLLLPVNFSDEDAELFDWVIIGALTGTYQRLIEIARKYPNLTLTKTKGCKWTLQPKIEWVREIVEACDKSGVKVFLKDSLKPLLDIAGCPPWAFEKPLSWEIHRRLRQETPN